MRRSLFLLLSLLAVGCGARSELLTPENAETEPDCDPLRIGIFGNPGTYDKSEFEGWLRSGGATVDRVQTTTAEPLTADVLARYDVVVLDWLTRDYDGSEAAVFNEWVTSGGGAMSMTGYDNNTTDDWHANSLLAPLGAAYSGPLIEGPVTDLAPHPITVGVLSIVFKGGYAISDLGGPGTRTPIAFLPSDSGKVTAGLTVEVGSGRAFVFGDEWIEFLSEEGSDFPPRLWIQTFAWLAPDKCVLTPPG